MDINEAEELAKAAWNCEADQFNQWSELGKDEKDLLIQQRMVAEESTAKITESSE